MQEMIAKNGDGPSLRKCSLSRRALSLALFRGRESPEYIFIAEILLNALISCAFAHTTNSIVTVRAEPASQPFVFFAIVFSFLYEKSHGGNRCYYQSTISIRGPAFLFFWSIPFYPECSTAVVISLPSTILVKNCSGTGLSKKSPSSSSGGVKMLMAEHLDVKISTSEQSLDRYTMQESTLSKLTVGARPKI